MVGVGFKIIMRASFGVVRVVSCVTLTWSIYLITEEPSLEKGLVACLLVLKL